MESINERIRIILKERKIKQHDFAVSLGITDSSVSTMCSGKSNPSGQTINDICRLYNVNRNWLETGEGEMFCPLSRTEEVAKFLNDLLLGDNSEEWQNARLTIIEALANMPPEFWKQAAAFIDEIAKRQKNKGQE